VINLPRSISHRAGPISKGNKSFKQTEILSQPARLREAAPRPELRFYQRNQPNPAQSPILLTHPAQSILNDIAIRNAQARDDGPIGSLDQDARLKHQFHCDRPNQKRSGKGEQKVDRGRIQAVQTLNRERKSRSSHQAIKSPTTAT
jgi:hypothetical protein